MDYGIGRNGILIKEEREIKKKSRPPLSFEKVYSHESGKRRDDEGGFMTAFHDESAALLHQSEIRGNSWRTSGSTLYRAATCKLSNWDPVSHIIN